MILRNSMIDHYSFRPIAGVAIISSCLLASCKFSGRVQEEKDIHFEEPPNIVMIAIDDMNDWIGAWGGQAINPHIDKLASEGRMFLNSYCIVPAVVTFEPNNHSVLLDNWNYIRYSDGSEELYDHEQDPGEFTNLALDPVYRALIDRLAAWIPETS